MRSTINRFLTFLSAFAVSFFALTPVAFAVENPNTGDNNMVPAACNFRSKEKETLICRFQKPSDVFHQAAFFILFFIDISYSKIFLH